MPQPSGPTHPYFDAPTPIAMAHRGFSMDGHENSMAAFAAAVDLGFRYVETDVHATSDGVLLAFHDATLDRVTDGVGRVAGLSWRQVRGARIGGVEPIPRLEELLGTWPELRVNIDIKAAGAVGPTVAAIERTRSHDRVCIASFSDARRRQVLRRLSRPVATSGGQRAIAAFWLAVGSRVSPLTEAAVRGIDCLQLPERQGSLRLVTPRTMAAAHALGRQVHVWTVNDQPAMGRLLDLGVDGLVTDRADLLRDTLIERGKWTV